MQPIELVTPLTPRRSSRRDHWTPDEARRVLADAAGSGLTLAAYARQHGLREQQMYWWNIRLRTHVDSTPSTRRPMAFVPVVQVRGPAASADSGIEVRVGDVTLQLRRDFCPDTLARAVAALRAGLPC